MGVKHGGSSLVDHSCGKPGSLVLMNSSPNTANYLWLQGKHEYALNVFYCNKLTIAKCLLNDHDGSYLIE